MAIFHLIIRRQGHSKNIHIIFRRDFFWLKFNPKNTTHCKIVYLWFIVLTQKINAFTPYGLTLFKCNIIYLFNISDLSLFSCSSFCMHSFVRFFMAFKLGIAVSKIFHFFIGYQYNSHPQLE